MVISGPEEVLIGDLRVEVVENVLQTFLGDPEVLVVGDLRQVVYHYVTIIWIGGVGN